MASELRRKHAFGIRRAIPADADVLFDIWWRSVCQTHDFLTQDDLSALAPQVRALGLVSLDTWVLCDAAAAPIGFLVMTGSSIEALFIAPEWMRRGGGSLLMKHAQSLRDRLSVDVNEQNVKGLEFYLSCGFSVNSRSDTDGEGRPFPILHLVEAQARGPI